MKILLINQQSTRNRGDMAIYLETLRLLHATFPDAQITLTFFDTETARADLPGYSIVGSLDHWAFAVDAAGMVSFTPLRQRMADLGRLAVAAATFRATGKLPRLFADPQKQETLAAFAAADLVLACGGGYIYDADVPRGLPAQLVSFLTWGVFVLGNFLLALALGKRLALLPQSIGPLRDPVRMWVVRAIVQRASFTAVREQRSLNLLTQLGCAQRALALPDIAFGLTGAPAAEGIALLERAGAGAISAAFRVGITALDWGGQQRTFDAQEAYERSLLTCIDSITAQGGAVVLFGQVVNRAVEWDDRAINRRLRERAAHPERILLIEELPPPDVLQAAYGRMDYFIGTRMHSVILALNAGVPAMAVGYLHKSAGMMEQIGLERHCYDIGALAPETLAEGFARLRADPHQPEAAAYLARARRYKRALGALLGAVAEEDEG
jgi:colanic acid/amylovoran biosynthesis protein